MAGAAVAVIHHRNSKGHARHFTGNGEHEQNPLKSEQDTPKPAPSVYIPRGNGHRNELHDIVGHHEPHGTPGGGDGEEGAELPPFQRKMLAIVQHWAFEPTAAIVIVLNAFVMGLSTELALQHHKENPDADSTSSSKALQVVSYFFFAFYSVELLTKVAAFRMQFFCNRDWKWNIMDLILVMTAIYDIVEQEADMGGSNVSFLRLLRLLKMVKMLRMFRVMKFFRELRVMMYAIVGSIRLLFWAMLMLAMISYIFSLVFLQGVNFKLTENLEESYREELLLYYGSVPKSMITLYEAITGGNDWSPLAEPLKDCGIGYYYLFLFYIAFLSVTVLNVLTGVVVDAAMMIAQLDGDNVTDEFISKDIAGKGLELLCDRMETSGNGYVEWDEVVSASETDLIREFLMNIDADFEEIEGFYRLMQCQDVNGHVKVRDFVKGCGNMKLWGPSKSIESFLLMRNLRKMMKSMDANFQRMISCFGQQGLKVPKEVNAMEEDTEEIFDGWDGAPATEVAPGPIILSGEWEQLFDRCQDAQVLKSVGDRAAIRIRELRQAGLAPNEMKADRPGARHSSQNKGTPQRELVSRLAGLIVQEATPLLLQELDKNAKSCNSPVSPRLELEPKMIGTSANDGPSSNTLDTLLQVPEDFAGQGTREFAGQGNEAFDFSAHGTTEVDSSEKASKGRRKFKKVNRD